MLLTTARCWRNLRTLFVGGGASGDQRMMVPSADAERSSGDEDGARRKARLVTAFEWERREVMWSFGA